MVLQKVDHISHLKTCISFPPFSMLKGEVCFLKLTPTAVWRNCHFRMVLPIYLAYKQAFTNLEWLSFVWILKYTPTDSRPTTRKIICYMTKTSLHLLSACVSLNLVVWVGFWWLIIFSWWLVRVGSYNRCLRCTNEHSPLDSRVAKTRCTLLIVY